MVFDSLQFKKLFSLRAFLCMLAVVLASSQAFANSHANMSNAGDASSHVSCSQDDADFQSHGTNQDDHSGMDCCTVQCAASVTLPLAQNGSVSIDYVYSAFEQAPETPIHSSTTSIETRPPRIS